MTNFFVYIGHYAVNFAKYAKDILHLLGEICFWVFIAPFRKKKLAHRQTIFEQMVFVGIKSVVIVGFVAMFTGLVLAMQSAYQLQKMGAVIYVASLVAISLCRELGPVLTSLVVAARSGSAITAEIGSMMVTEQVTALEVMGINPIRFLAVPKVIALAVMLPLLTILADFFGMFGGYLVGTLSLKISSPLYIQTTVRFLALKDIYTGIFKSFIFAILIGLVGCYWGFSTKGGAQAVGKSTTISVVTSFVLIIIFDSILTGIFYFSNM